MANNVRRLRKARDMTLAELAEMTDISDSYLSRIESQKRGLSLENLVRIARALEVDPSDISDEFHPDDLENVESLKLPVRKTGDIASFNIHAGMGDGGALSVIVDEDGRAIDPADSDGFWSFPDTVKAGWRNIRKTYAMPVTGDSMEPTLQSGAYVFVDTAHTVPSPPDLYAVDYGDGLMIKRIELVPQSKKVRVISDNDRYSNYELNREEVNVYGRVVAFFQWRG